MSSAPTSMFILPRGQSLPILKDLSSARDISQNLVVVYDGSSRLDLYAMDKFRVALVILNFKVAAAPAELCASHSATEITVDVEEFMEALKRLDRKNAHFLKITPDVGVEFAVANADYEMGCPRVPEPSWTAQVCDVPVLDESQHTLIKTEDLALLNLSVFCNDSPIDITLSSSELELRCNSPIGEFYVQYRDERKDFEGSAKVCVTAKFFRTLVTGWPHAVVTVVCGKYVVWQNSNRRFVLLHQKK